MKDYKLKLALAAAVVLSFLGQSFSASAGNVNVSVVNFAFVPASTNIHVNDTVLWTWPSGSDQHTVTSDSAPQAWVSSAILNGPATFTNVFTNAGTFPYECIVHGFTGTITVEAAPPAITITSPASSAVFAAPANVTIQASTSGGTVTNVEFLSGSSVLANVRTPPFSASATGLAAGAHTLSAIAFGNTGLKATNSISITVVNPMPISLSNIMAIAGSFQFESSVDPGLSYVLQRSADLSSWTSLLTNVATNNPALFVDTQATNSMSFYRIGLLPNP